jgi:hypothetical protein
MCVIDHCGYRVIAAAVLPISSTTIKYGSRYALSALRWNHHSLTGHDAQ